MGVLTRVCVCVCVCLSSVIDGSEVVYREYIDISVAVATPKVGTVMFSAPKLAVVHCRVSWSLSSEMCKE